MSGLLSGILKKSVLPTISITRGISATSVSRMKQIEIVHDESKQVINIKGNYVPSPHTPNLLKVVSDCHKNGEKFCPECTLGLNIRHTDVLILSQYVRPDGCMLPRRVTGLCKRQQKRMGTMVTMAQRAGLMINLTPKYCKKDPTKRFQEKKFNKYYFEETIK